MMLGGKLSGTLPLLLALSALAPGAAREGLCGEEAAEAAKAPVMLFPIVKDGKWGYMDRSGKVKIEPCYDAAFDFSEGLACVAQYPLRGYIDATGKMVIEPKFVWAGPFQEGRAVVIVSPKMYGGNPSFYHNPYTLRVIDRTGNFDAKAPPPRGGKAGFHEGKLIATTRDKSEVYDLELKKLSCEAEQICIFSEGMAPARKGKVWGYMNHDLKWAIEPKYACADGFSEGLAAVGNEKPDSGDKKKWSRGEPECSWGYIDKTGATVIEHSFDDTGSFSEGLAPVCAGGKWGYIDRAGKTVIEPAYDYAWPFSEGMARILTGEKQGFIDKKGALLVKPQYQPAWDFSKGLARVTTEDGSEGYIDAAGAYVWEPTK